MLRDPLQNIGWVLTDALYMHAAWATPFDPNETSPGRFTTSSGQHVTAQFMTGGQYSVGIEASAGRVLAPPVVFNRPYLIVVTGRATGEPLFLARVTDPATG